MLFKPKHTDNVKDIVFFSECEMYFPLVLSRFNSKELIKTLNKVLRQPWNTLTLQLSLSLRNR